MAKSESKKGATAIICLSHYYGGMELDSIRYADLLAKATEVTMICKRGSAIEENVKNSNLVKKLRLESVSFRFKFSMSIILTVRRVVKNNHIKNVIFFGASELRSLYFSFFNLNINFIIRHGTTKSHPKKDFFHRLIYSDVSWHIPISEHIAKNVLYIIPFGRKTQMKVIYPSLRFEPFFRHKDISDKAPIKLLHVARITEGKGSLDAIEACQNLYNKHIPFELVFVGQVEQKFQIKLDNYLKGLPYVDSIKLLGFKKDVSPFYLEADIFLFPSKGEGLGNSFIEALAHGIICISYDNTVFPEYKRLGFTIYMAADGDVNDLKNKLMDAVQCLEKTGLPIQKNIELARSVFSRDKELDELIDILT